MSLDVKIDLGEVQINNLGEFESLPNDRYNFLIKRAEVKELPKSQKIVLEATCVVVDGKYRNRRIWNSFFLSPNALWVLKTFLKAAAPELVDHKGSVADLATKIVGLKFSAYLENREKGVRLSDYSSMDDEEVTEISSLLE